MWHLQPKPQGRNHHDSEVPKLWKETSRLEHIMPREERERMKVALEKIQPQNTTEAPHSTFVWGQQRQKTVNPTPTPP
ncbi:hypothetical protein Hamer_G000516 [Homarus americanus]|uniref:Uncharacterized protein n=1 Tax=Homarus americanus TaxID=6706 RepID=A0A8J5NAW3_HOMAM|nr:hypothetical protein Hamer_G000516 [Homarus americanus]